MILCVFVLLTRPSLKVLQRVHLLGLNLSKNVSDWLLGLNSEHTERVLDRILAELSCHHFAFNSHISLRKSLLVDVLEALILHEFVKGVHLLSHVGS